MGRGAGVVALATGEGRNTDGSFAALWNLSITARTAMICQAHYALRKHLADDLCANA